jgi:hypothetical protein
MAWHAWVKSQNVGFSMANMSHGRKSKCWFQHVAGMCGGQNMLPFNLATLSHSQNIGSSTASM